MSTVLWPRALLTFIAQSHSLSQHEYFTKLQDPSLSLASFLASQKLFLMCVSNWTNALASLLLKTESKEGRSALVRNLYDEHGEGDLSKVHTVTFQNFLDLLESHVRKVESTSIPPSSSWNRLACTKFNHSLLQYIDQHSWQEGMAYLG